MLGGSLPQSNTLLQTRKLCPIKLCHLRGFTSIMDGNDLGHRNDREGGMACCQAIRRQSRWMERRHRLKGLHDHSVYLRCTSLRRFYGFPPFCYFVESITYVESIPLRGSTPTPGTIF